MSTKAPTASIYSILVVKTVKVIKKISQECFMNSIFKKTILYLANIFKNDRLYG